MGVIVTHVLPLQMNHISSERASRIVAWILPFNLNLSSYALLLRFASIQTTELDAPVRLVLASVFVWTSVSNVAVCSKRIKRDPSKTAILSPLSLSVSFARSFAPPPLNCPAIYLRDREGSPGGRLPMQASHIICRRALMPMAAITAAATTTRTIINGPKMEDDNSKWSQCFISSRFIQANAINPLLSFSLSKFLSFAPV